MLRAVVVEARPATAAYDVIVRLKRGCSRAEIGAVAAEAESVIVPRDPKADRSRPLTSHERELLQAELGRDASASSGER